MISHLSSLHPWSDLCCSQCDTPRCVHSHRNPRSRIHSSSARVAWDLSDKTVNKSPLLSSYLFFIDQCPSGVQTSYNYRFSRVKLVCLHLFSNIETFSGYCFTLQVISYEIFFALLVSLYICKSQDSHTKCKEKPTMFPEPCSAEQNADVCYLLASLKTFNSLTVLVRLNLTLHSLF